MKPLVELRGRPRESARAGTLRRADLEAYGTLIDALGDGVVLVTGAGEARLAVATGLAGARAASGSRVALVDCDLAEPALDRALGLSPGPGMQEYLRAEVRAPEILQPLVLAGPAAGRATEPLVCIVAGEPAADVGGTPTDSPDFSHAVGRLRSSYDMVVLRGPPLGDQSGALAAIAARADRLLVCVGPRLVSGRPGRRLKRSLSRFEGRAGPADIVVYRS